MLVTILGWIGAGLIFAAIGVAVLPLVFLFIVTPFYALSEMGKKNEDQPNYIYAIRDEE